MAGESGMAGEGGNEKSALESRNRVNREGFPRIGCRKDGQVEKLFKRSTSGAGILPVRILANNQL